MESIRTGECSRRAMQRPTRRNDGAIARSSLGVALLVALLGIPSLSGCAVKAKTLQLNAAILYEKPAISDVSHAVEDSRPDGGTTVVTVAMVGDPGLNGTFDISPGIAERVPLREVEGGRYEGEYRLPRETLGGPYTVIGRLEHERAGGVTQRDPHPITISIYDE